MQAQYGENAVFALKPAQASKMKIPLRYIKLFFLFKSAERNISNSMLSSDVTLWPVGLRDSTGSARWETRPEQIVGSQIFFYFIWGGDTVAHSFVCLFVCWFVSRIMRKSTKQISTELGGKIGRGPWKNPFKFGVESRKRDKYRNFFITFSNVAW